MSYEVQLGGKGERGSGGQNSSKKKEHSGNTLLSWVNQIQQIHTSTTEASTTSGMLRRYHSTAVILSPSTRRVNITSLIFKVKEKKTVKIPCFAQSCFLINQYQKFSKETKRKYCRSPATCVGSVDKRF